MQNDTHQSVQRYYGEELQSSEDLKTNACCTLDAPPDYLKPLLANVHEQVQNRYYGCGLVAPSALHGAHVLDLGCGVGRDMYLLAQLVGETGQVTGIDMTEAQLQLARDTAEWHRGRFGYAKTNTRFLEGYIEDLNDLKIAPQSIDVIVSNCVVNLATDKAAVFRGAYDLLKSGGEFYFSDVYSDRRIPNHLRDDPILYGECLSGALYRRDFQKLAQEAGFAAPVRVSSRVLEITDPGIREKLGETRFTSETWRLFKLDGLEPSQEDYGQTATYHGGLISGDFEEFAETGEFAKGVPVPVDGNLAKILQQSRYAPFFSVSAPGRHRGAFAA